MAVEGAFAVSDTRRYRLGQEIGFGLDLLRKARTVHVLCANRPADMPAVLEEHDIPAELHTVPDGDDTAAARILQAAHGIGADFLVMGAFAHGEWREMMFGGVTRTMLAEADLPLFMRH